MQPEDVDLLFNLLYDQARQANSKGAGPLNPGPIVLRFFVGLIDDDLRR